MLANNHVLIEGGFMDQIVEVYDITSQEEGSDLEPVHVIETGCRGLNAIEHTEYLIFLAFMGTLTETECLVQVYNYEYELQACINLGIQEKMFTDISVCMDDNYLVGSHTEGIVSVISLETQEVQVIEEPFGAVDSIWGTELYEPRPEGEPQTIYMPSTNGLYCCILSPEGQFMYCCLLYTSPSPRDRQKSRMPSSA